MEQIIDLAFRILRISITILGIFYCYELFIKKSLVNIKKCFMIYSVLFLISTVLNILKGIYIVAFTDLTICITVFMAYNILKYNKL